MTNLLKKINPNKYKHQTMKETFNIVGLKLLLNLNQMKHLNIKKIQ